jgi:phospholipase C
LFYQTKEVARLFSIRIVKKQSRKTLILGSVPAKINSAFSGYSSKCYNRPVVFGVCRRIAQPTAITTQEAGRVKKLTIWFLYAVVFFVCISFPKPSEAQTGLHRVNHIIVVMQENHSFDNYFGALSYAPGSPYHSPRGTGGCDPNDHACLEGLTCMLDATGTLHCFDSNLDDNGSQVFAFHEASRCVIPDLNHSWFPTHQEANYLNPQNTLGQSLNDGFVRVNDSAEQIDNGVEASTEDQTIGFYNQADIPFYYDLAQKFAISDRHFSSVLGPTFPNRSSTSAVNGASGRKHI